MEDLSRILKTALYSVAVTVVLWCSGDTSTNPNQRAIEQERAQAEQSVLVGESYNQLLKQEIERSYRGRR